MHFNFDWNALQIIWTLTFAALLVLLVVLLGRDRARRYPWFTVSIVLVTLDMLGKRLLLRADAAAYAGGNFHHAGRSGRCSLALLVVVEMARQCFQRELSRSIWIVNGLGMLTVAGLVLARLGTVAGMEDGLTANSHLAVLGLMQLPPPPRYLCGKFPVFKEIERWFCCNSFVLSRLDPKFLEAKELRALARVRWVIDGFME
jgi:hypothetical protein